ncbi:hypothetical protein L249_0390 [Ophiocordyceps polyrhachis-furcata BCC 54312]|uniref:peptidyl-tRNA hydrolase n=1 Tax=Ophiocordyceps polyrhachis-furcata BCC 54312 TaxID=1330021 RepID=A0A367LEH0_9HYPO|nr:hypothetical protein L249_0390 [Ophiocordyceps polyrhachis-furcata BCC 54312]
MAPDQGAQTGVILTTALATFVTGFLFGVFTSRGYLISPALTAERQRNLHDPVESDESDIDEHQSLLDHAPNWANGRAADRKQGLSFDKEMVASAAADDECKLVLVVRTDLGMTKGKMAAQCSHATLACYKKLARAPPTSPLGMILTRWEKNGQAKIALQAKSEEEVRDLRRKALAAGLVADIVQDAGRTQIEAGSLTVLGIGPAPKSAIDQITGHLKLL